MLKNTINLQDKTQVGRGSIAAYWFENPFIGLKNTLFHRIEFPLSPFDSGLEYEQQPLETQIVMEWLILDAGNGESLDNLSISSSKYRDMEASVYVGGAHNVCEVIRLHFNRKAGNDYEVEGELMIDFESEGVAQNEAFTFQSMIHYSKHIE